jgi:hypothetical protein
MSEPETTHPLEGLFWEMAVEKRPLRRNRVYLHFIFPALLSVPFFFLLWRWWIHSLHHIPGAGEVISMQATLRHSPKGLGGIPTFTVPPQHFARILGSLRPYSTPEVVCKWASIGELQLTCWGGRRFEITIFMTKDGPGAFAAGPTWEDRVYYVGGTDAAIEDAIRAAHASASR